MRNLICKEIKMKDYLEGRIKDLEQEYVQQLTKIGNIQSEDKREEWKVIDDKKSRIEECRLILAYFKEAI